ncbi:DUF3068 domain-containing protein [Actinomycetes bacterium M1A6_2h]
MRQWSGLRIASLLLVALGCFMAVVAVALPTYVYDRLAKTPLDVVATTVATTAPGFGGEVLDSSTISRPGPLAVARDVPLIVQRFITVEEPSDSERVTFQSGATVRRADRPGDAGLLTASVDRVTSDRRTGLSVEPEGTLQTTLDAPAIPLPREGIQQRFPFDTRKQTYTVYDSTSWTSFDANFVEETTLDGLDIYHFRTVIENFDLSTTTTSPINTVTLPASKWGVGDSEEPVTMKRFYSNVRDIFVEPLSGSLVSGQETPYQYFARDPKVPEVSIFKASLSLDDAGRAEQVARAKDSADKLMWLTFRGPLSASVIGGLSLVVGLALALVSRRSRSRSSDSPAARPVDRSQPVA